MKEAAIGVIFNANRSQVLLVKRRDVPVWVLPGGGIEENESSESAVLRELLEETGLVCVIVRKVAFYTPLNHLAQPTHLYECLRISGDLTTGSETSSVAYFSLKNLPRDFFIVHQDWLNDTMKQEKEMIKSPIWRVTYWELTKYFACHPYRVLRFLYTLLVKK